MVEAMDTLGDTAFLLLLDRAKQRNDSGSKATREAIGSTLLVSSSSSKIARRRGRETEQCSSGLSLLWGVGERKGWRAAFNRATIGDAGKLAHELTIWPLCSLSYHSNMKSSSESFSTRKWGLLLTKTCQIRGKLEQCKLQWFNKGSHEMEKRCRVLSQQYIRVWA